MPSNAHQNGQCELAVWHIDNTQLEITQGIPFLLSGTWVSCSSKIAGMLFRHQADTLQSNLEKRNAQEEVLEAERDSGLEEQASEPKFVFCFDF